MTQSALLDNEPADWDDLSSGVAVSFPILGIKGGKWHYRFKGADDIIADARGFAVPALEVVVVKAQKELSRTFYPGGYVEGVNSRPVCWSSDGVRPDDTVTDPINPVCATCPNAQWGSGATPAAPKAQACQQRRRVVVVPYSDDLTNEAGGGAILLSVPPSSLRNLDGYSGKLKGNRVHYYGCVTQLNFDQDPTVAFPRVEFSWMRPLSDEEVAVVMEMRKSDQVDRILNSKINVDGPELDPDAEAAAAAAAPPKPNAQSQPIKAATQPVIPKPGQKPMATATAPVAAPAPAPVAAPVTRVGGFAVKATSAASVAPVATKPVAAAPKVATPIASAVTRPAAAPVSARVVDTQPEVAEGTQEEAEAAGLPTEVDSAFGSLMSSLG